MVRTKISEKPKTSFLKGKNLRIEDFVGVKEHSPVKRILDKKFVGAAILECLSNNDPEGVIDVIEMYLETLNKTQTAKKSDLPRPTLYHTLRRRNPTVKTLAKLVHASTH